MNHIATPGAQITQDPQAAALWEKLRRFSFGRGTGPRTFARRLAQEQNWSDAFTALAVEEYRRFLLLFALSGENPPDAPVQIVPSAVVDEVWHLHLLYTQNYWDDLCRDTLPLPLHHLPADGSGGEGPALDAVYAQTLAAYRRTFGHDAPELVWPGAESPANPPPVAGSARGFAGAAVLIGGGLVVTLILVLGQALPLGSLVVAGIVALFALIGFGSRGSTRRRRSGGGGETAGGWSSGDSSGGGDTGSMDSSHHGHGSHGGGHDAGGHSHSCGGGHSCGGHSCGGHGCGGGH